MDVHAIPLAAAGPLVICGVSPLSREIVRPHDGKIWAESPGLGQGSRFFVLLPVRPRAALGRRPAARQPAGG